MANDMCKDEFYLVVRRKQWRLLSARLTAGVPSLAADEVAIKLSVEVPLAMFQRPSLQATVRIPPDAVTPPVLDATVMDNVREIIEQQTGMQLSISVVEPTRLIESD